MKVLHTSDWHIGRSLYGRKRYDEYRLFLSWLTGTIQKEKIDVLLIAGDVFDTTTPSNRAQELYYRFLCSIAASSCRHVVVIAGNHDSPSFLNAPKELLKVLNVHVVGNITENREDEILVLNNEQGDPGLIVCAVPYLRDRDIRTVEANEGIEEKETKLIEGIYRHYKEVAILAEQKKLELGMDIPIIAMGHLFTAGGQTTDGDGVRELYIGTLARIRAERLSEGFDYMALGHLHRPQKMDSSTFVQYSGSPLPMGFGECKQEKNLFIVEFMISNSSDLESRPYAVSVSPIKVPLFQQIERIKGDWEEISTRIQELLIIQSERGASILLEIIYDGEEVIGDLRERLDEMISGHSIEILHLKNNRIFDRVLNQSYESETLDDLNEKDVFERCLSLHNVPDEQRMDLIGAYQEVLNSMYECDVRAE